MTNADQHLAGYRDGLLAVHTMTQASRERVLRECTQLSANYPYARGFIEALKETTTHVRQHL